MLACSLWRLCWLPLVRFLQAVKGIDLSVAYALWGGFGIAATLAAGWILFGQRLNRKGWIGLVLLLAGMIMVKLA